MGVENNSKAAADSLNNVKSAMTRSSMMGYVATTVLMQYVMADNLRGAFFQGDERLLQEEEEEVGKADWWFYLLMPFIAGIVGYGTNWLALKMTFYPYKFWGPEIMRFENQPIGLFGWQGIVPTKAEKMASDSVDLMTEKLFNIKEIFSRIEKDKAAEHLKGGFEQTVNTMIDNISDKYIIDKNTAWKRTEGAIKKQVTNWALAELPEFTSNFMGDLIENLDDVYDLKYMCVTEMVNDPGLLVDVFLTVGKKELGFIEKSGFIFGFLFGSIQALLSRYAIPAPWDNRILPILGFVVGYLTNEIALYMIFKPIDPKPICGGRITLQGLFLKRQQEASATFASKMVASVLHSEKIWSYMLKGPKKDNFEALLKKHADDFTVRMMGYTKPLVESYMGGDFDKMREEVQELTVQEIENIIAYMHDYTDQALDLETEIRTKMQALPSNEFERVLHPVFEEDEFKLILIGGVLGSLVGTVQFFIGASMSGEY